jgi:hypothetical protein
MNYYYYYYYYNYNGYYWILDIDIFDYNYIEKLLIIVIRLSGKFYGNSIPFLQSAIKWTAMINSPW